MHQVGRGNFARAPAILPRSRPFLHIVVRRRSAAPSAFPVDRRVRRRRDLIGGLCGPGGVCPTGTYPEPQMFNSGPPTGQVAYPYYTTRGPRDFLMRNPPSIGPY